MWAIYLRKKNELVEEISMDKLRSMNLAWINSGEVTILNNAFPAKYKSEWHTCIILENWFYHAKPQPNYQSMHAVN